MTAPPVGLPPGLFAFFDDLRGDNSKTFWAANKDRWEREVRTPFRSVVDVLAEEFGPLRVFRPNRDVRFSADKSPYRTWTGATSESHAVGGIGYYLEASAVGVVTGYGTMVMTPGQLRRFRAAVDDETSGQELEQIGAALAECSLPLSHGAEQPLRTTPRGFSADHPRIHLLRWKGVVVVREWSVAEWMHTPEILEAARGVWRAAAPLKSWLDMHVTSAVVP